jgi:uncharacterized protein YbjT (DUF2867 family)
MTISQEISAPLVVVVGATGTQGGSVIKALAESDRPYRIRGLTRDPSKPVALNLADQGVNIFSVSISIDNVENVRKAFEGANIIFVSLLTFHSTTLLSFRQAMTNFWEHADKQRVSF